MRKIFLYCLTCVLFITVSQAQNYSTGIGIRGGFFSGITVKHFINDGKALEGIVGTRYKGYGIVGLYEIHKQAFEVEGLYWLYGGGAHIANYYTRSYYPPGHRHYDEGYAFNFGIDGILGIEYQIQEIPFTVGIDIKPAISFIYPGPELWGGGLSIRYAF